MCLLVIHEGNDLWGKLKICQIQRNIFVCMVLNAMVHII